MSLSKFDNESDLFEFNELKFESECYSRKMRRAKRMYDAGFVDAAANLCTHNARYPLFTIAAEDDPRRGEPHYRCSDCGSVIDWKPTDHYYATRLVVACEAGVRKNWGVTPAPAVVWWA